MQAYDAEDVSAEGDFSERLQTLSENISKRYQQKFGSTHGQKLTTSELTELLYTHDIKRLRELISDYLDRKGSVWVLFDNLDKGWSTHGVDAIDAISLRCLVDAGRKVEREMRKEGHEFHCIVFVRNDVYDHLMRSSPDYGKEIRATLDWSDPDLLREMLRLRLVSGLDGDIDKVTFQAVWNELCVSHYLGEESSAYMIDRTLMRPRNLIKVFNHCRGAAGNFTREKIDNKDIEKGLDSYSSDLLQELDRELTDVFPEAKDLLYHFLDATAALTSTELEAIYTSAKIGPNAHAKVTEFLLYYGVLGIRTPDQDYFIYAVGYDLKVLMVRAARTGADTVYVVNPGFWPCLKIKNEN